MRTGDGFEYLLMIEGLIAHGTPELQPEDLETLAPILERNGVSPPREPVPGYYPSADGRLYSLHFWLYPLLCLPARLLLGLGGGNEMAAMQATNALLFAAAVGLAFFYGRAPTRERALLVLLSAVGPVIWFHRWTHPEVFTWACVLAVVVLLREQRHALASLAAALGGTQNPPLALLCLLAVFLAFRARDRRSVLGAAAGALPLFLPLFYNLAVFKVPNPLAAGPAADLAYISLGRTVSFFLDLNQGMLIYVPATLILAAAGGARALRARSVTGAAALATLLGMILLIETTENWNAGTVGMVRYAVWMLPLFAWLAVDLGPRGRAVTWILVLGLLFQARTVWLHDSRENHLKQNGVARFFLLHAPRLYNPEFEIFAERQLHREGDWRALLPIGFANPEGTITKLLVREEDEVPLRRLLPDGQEEPPGGGRGQSGRPRNHYVHPPAGALRIVEPLGWGKRALENGIRLRLAGASKVMKTPLLRVEVAVANKAHFPFWGISSGASHPLLLGYRLMRDGQVIGQRQVPTPFVLLPNRVAQVDLEIGLPDETGHFEVEIDALLDRLAWAGRPLRLGVDVLAAGPEGYGARVRVLEGTEPPREPGSGAAGAAAGE